MSRIDIEAIEDEWEDHEVLPPPGSRPKGGEPDRSHLPIGRILGLHKGWVDVLVEGEEVSAVYGGAMRGEHVVVGDRVRVSPAERDTDTARIVERLERDTVLTRTADDVVPEERVVVANADQAVVVLGTEPPDIGARFVDRVMVAASAGGLDGAICVNKIDLPESHPEEIRRIYEPLGYEVVATSAETGQGVDLLRELLTACWTVLSGHSGVGKSSLVNRMDPEAGQRVGELGRHGGRHTTVSPRAIPLDGDSWIVDTPGVRSFGIGHLAPDELADHFPELADLPCELPACLHDGEPGCEAEDPGRGIEPSRLDSYRGFLRALRGDHDEP